MDWLPVLVNLIVTGILLYVFQKTIDERSARRLEEFKTELQLTSFEKGTKFSKLHEKRIVIIQEIYEKLEYILKNLYSLKHVLENNETISYKEISEKFNIIQEATKEFKSYLDTNKLYLPKELFYKLTKFYLNSMIAGSGLNMSFLSKDFASRTEEDTKLYIDRHKSELIESALMLAEKIVPLKNEIEIEFRNLLGS